MLFSQSRVITLKVKIMAVEPIEQISPRSKTSPEFDASALTKKCPDRVINKENERTAKQLSVVPLLYKRPLNSRP